MTAHARPLVDSLSAIPPQRLTPAQRRRAIRLVHRYVERQHKAGGSQSCAVTAAWLNLPLSVVQAVVNESTRLRIRCGKIAVVANP